jgi:hypothetical protein
VTHHADTDRTGCRLVWSWALGYLRKPPADPARRAKQRVLVAVLAGDLRDVDTVAGLHARYADPEQARHCLAIARGVYPGEWPALGIHACTAAAYGVRFVELQTRQRLDARRLPGWVGEWAVYP